MKRKLELIHKLNSIIYQEAELKKLFSEYLPFKLEQNETYFQGCLTLSEEENINLILTELANYDMFDCSDEFKNNVSETITEMLGERYCFNPSLLDIVSCLKLASPNSCIVGGSIRDYANFTYRKHEFNTPKDFDFVTDLSYEELQTNLEDYGFSVETNGKNFLVLRATKFGDTYEVACFRKDGTYKDGRRPETVSIGNIYDDSSRRDFTVNSLYYNLDKKVVLDPTGMGLEDIKTKTLRFNGNAYSRIKEDNLRVLRAYRFISKGYKPSNQTLNALRANFNHCIKNTDANRIREEIEKISKL